MHSRYHVYDKKYKAKVRSSAPKLSASTINSVLISPSCGDFDTVDQNIIVIRKQLKDSSPPAILLSQGSSLTQLSHRTKVQLALKSVSLMQKEAKLHVSFSQIT